MLSQETPAVSTIIPVTIKTFNAAIIMDDDLKHMRIETFFSVPSKHIEITTTAKYIEITTEDTVVAVKRKMVRALESTLLAFHVPAIRDAHGNYLHSLYLDDPPDKNFIDLIRGGREAFDLDLSALTFHVTFFSPLGYRPTQHNPNGYHANLRLQNTPFIRAALGESKAFSIRFAELQERTGSVDLPDAFVDPITDNFMNTPMLASDGRIYDKSTVERLPVSPYDRKRFDTVHNLLLRSEIEDFLTALEHGQEPRLGLYTSEGVPAPDFRSNRIAARIAAAAPPAVPAVVAAPAPAAAPPAAPAVVAAPSPARPVAAAAVVAAGAVVVAWRVAASTTRQDDEGPGLLGCSVM
jgi:hypothetical protein